MSLLRDRLLALLERLGHYLEYIYPVFFLFGFLAVIYLPAQDIFPAGHVYERALLADYASTMYTAEDAKNIPAYVSQLSRATDRDDTIMRLLHEAGFSSVRKQLWTDDSQKIESNIYATMRAIRGDHTEAMLVGAPKSSLEGIEENDLGIAMIISLLQSLSKEFVWAKDIVIVIPSRGHIGMKAWADYYHGAEKAPIKTLSHFDAFGNFSSFARSGIVHMGYILDLKNMKSLSDKNTIVVHPFGFNGGMPNMDLLTIIQRVCRRQDVLLSFSSKRPTFLSDTWSSSLNLLDFIMKQGFAPFTEGIHGPLMNHRIDALTISAHNFPVEDSHHPVNTILLLEIIESLLRSSSITVEHLIQSFFFYLLPSTDYFIPLSLYSPGVIGILAGLVVFAVYIWQSKQKKKLETGKTISSSLVAASIALISWSVSSIILFGLLWSPIRRLILNLINLNSFMSFIVLAFFFMLPYFLIKACLPSLLPLLDVVGKFDFDEAKALIILIFCAGQLVLFLMNYSISLVSTLLMTIPLWTLTPSRTSRIYLIQQIVFAILSPSFILMLASVFGPISLQKYFCQTITAHGYGKWYLWEILPFYWSTLVNMNFLASLSYQKKELKVKEE